MSPSSSSCHPPVVNEIIVPPGSWEGFLNAHVSFVKSVKIIQYLSHLLFWEAGTEGF